MTFYYSHVNYHQQLRKYLFKYTYTQSAKEMGMEGRFVVHRRSHLNSDVSCRD